ncbi:MAG TPA: L,D-transpeptidase family protein [Methyloceanibacter sp.]|jgi:murein L,D-transpeptidase YcbB/YkuD|nr:L,D-transpeptidase family protein [Methyloceanibacter sp.]
MGGWSLVGRFGAMARVAIFALSIVGAALAEVVSSGAQAPDGSKPSSTVELAVTPPDQSNQQAPSPTTAATNPPTQSSGSGNDAASPAQTAAIAPSEAQHQPLDSVGPARAAAEPAPSDTAAPASGDDTPADRAAPSEDEIPDATTAPNKGDHKPSDAAAPASSEAAAPEQAAADPIVAAIREKLKDPALRKSANSDDLAALADFYAERSNPLWITSMGFSARAQSLIGEIQDADDWGLASEAFSLPPAADLPATTEAQAADEIKLGLAVLKYARLARGGRMTPARVSVLLDQKATLVNPKTVLTEIADSTAPDAYLRSLQPKQEQFERLHQALVKLRASLKARGRKPASDPVVQRIVINMERWRWMPPELGSYYVWDNIPAFTARVMKNGKSIYVEKVVVGQLKYATPIFSAHMRSIAFNPEWIVPETIKLEDLQPALRGGVFGVPDTSVLRDHELTVSYQGKPVDAEQVDWGRANILQYTFTQPPGPDNVLGKLKFNFPNKHAIYMHDTIQPEFFDEEVRALSHGCIRVRQPDRLATLLLGEDKGWSVQQVQDLLATGNNSIVPLARPVPVHLTYFTVVADEKGKLQTFADIYGIDAKMSSLLFGTPLRSDGGTVEAAGDGGAPPKKRAAWNSGQGSLSDAINGLFGN